MGWNIGKIERIRRAYKIVFVSNTFYTTNVYTVVDGAIVNVRILDNVKWSSNEFKYGLGIQDNGSRILLSIPEEL